MAEFLIPILMTGGQVSGNGLDFCLLQYHGIHTSLKVDWWSGHSHNIILPGSQSQSQIWSLFRSYWGPLAWQSRWINERWKPTSQKPLTAEVSAKLSIKHQLHTTHVLAGNGRAVLPRHARGRWITSYQLKTSGTHAPIHSLAITSRMRTVISRGQWQLRTAVSSTWHSPRSVTGKDPGTKDSFLPRRVL